MSDVPPSAPPPSAPPPPSGFGSPGASGPVDPGPPPVGGVPPPKGGLSTGAKIAIGCGVLALLALILMFACFGFAAKKASDFGRSLEDQEEAGRTAQELEREHAFTPPADGVLDEDLVDKFFAVTDDVWDDIDDWARDIEARSDRIDERGGEAGFGDAVAGVQGMGRARMALVEALEDHDLAPSAYVWTGFNLVRAYDAQAGGSAAGVPERNLELAREYAERIRELKDEDDAEPDRGVVLGLAYVFFPRMDVLGPAGIDTMGVR